MAMDFKEREKLLDEIRIIEKKDERKSLSQKFDRITK